MIFERYWRKNTDISSPAKPLVFVHIPKTAGTSFIRYLKANIPEDRIGEPFTGDMNAIGIGQPDIALIWGHFRYAKIKPLVPKGDYLTFLRHPVDRAFSQYKSWHNPDNLRPHDPWRAKMDPEQVAAVELAQKISFDEFILAENWRFDDNIRDIHTWMLSSKRFEDPDFLSSAKRTLRSMRYIGIVEQFDRSLALLQSAFDGLGPYEVESRLENRSPEAEMTVSEPAMRRLETMIGNDLRLYEYALRLFERKHAWWA